MSKKPYLFIDFDDCLVDSLPVVVDILNKKYNTAFCCEDVDRWDLTDCWPTLTNEELNWAFECDEFWSNVKMKEDAFYSLQNLRYFYNIYIVSKGTPLNLKRKKEWISENLNWDDTHVTFIPIEIGHSKGEVPMPPRSIMVDDNERYLDETQATVKILYESYRNKQWNKHWNGFYTDNWVSLFSFLQQQAMLMNGGLQDE